MPFLSTLAKEGAVFDRCFATAALCALSRAGLLTGSFQQSWGAYWNKDVDDHGIPAERVIIAEPLKEAGYRCGMVGKWHVAKKDRAIMERIWVEELGQTLPIPNGYRGEGFKIRICCACQRLMELRKKRLEDAIDHFNSRNGELAEPKAA